MLLQTVHVTNVTNKNRSHNLVRFHFLCLGKYFIKITNIVAGNEIN